MTLLHTSNNSSPFYSFPFLRDFLFISYFRSLKPQTVNEFESFIFKAQLDYYLQFIDKSYNHSQYISSLLNSASRCPFASKQSTLAKSLSFVIEPISKVRYTLLQDVHISDMNLSGLTVNLIHAGSEIAQDAQFKMFLNGTHDSLKHLNESILCNNAQFSNIKLESFPQARFTPDLTAAIIKAKSNSLSASDVHYLFPSNTMIINQDSIDKILNILVYLNIAGIPLTLETLKMTGIGGTGQPSSIEPYEDVLSIEYLQNNPNIFS